MITLPNALSNGVRDVTQIQENFDDLAGRFTSTTSPTFWETGNAAVLAWNEQIEALGNANGWPVVDYYTPFMSGGSQISSLFVDGIHPNEDGHALMAEILSPVLSAL